MGGSAFHGNASTGDNAFRGNAPTSKAESLARQAPMQIKEKGYAEKYLRQGKKVTLVGAAFDAEMRNLSDRAIVVAG